ncbi:hypothetical protein M9458_017600, partial [Cirrhinus mrigala]
RTFSSFFRAPVAICGQGIPKASPSLNRRRTILSPPSSAGHLLTSTFLARSWRRPRSS